MTRTRFLNPEFQVPISFIYGDDDWVRKTVDFDQADLLARQKQEGKIRVYSLQESTHDMLFDNPLNLCNLIKNDILGTQLPVGPDPTRRTKII